MKRWIVKWFDGGALRQTVVEGFDLFAVASNMSGAGMWNTSGVVSVELIPEVTP